MREHGAPGKVVRMVAVAAVVAAGPPPLTGAQTREERRAYSELASAAAAFERAGGLREGLSAVQRVLQAAESAHRVFQQADGRRDVALERDAAAHEQDNAAILSAHAEYAEAVGEHGADRFRQAAARLRSMANIDDAELRRVGALINEWDRLEAAHTAANSAALRALARAARTVLAATDQLVQDDWPDTGATAVYRARAALDRVQRNPITAGVDGVMTAMRVAVDVLDRHLQAVEQAAAEHERRYAAQGGGTGAAPQEPAPAGGGAPRPGVGETVETPAPSSPREWLETVTNLLEEVEGYVAAAAETDDSVRCWNVAHAQNMASSRLLNLVSGLARPQFIPAEIAGQAREQLREREQAAQNQVREICANKPLP